MSGLSILGFVLTILALTSFMAASYWQLVRVRRTASGRIEVGGTAAQRDGDDGGDAGRGGS